MLDSLKSAARNRTTYTIGLLQAKVYRLLKKETGTVLEKFGISTVEWALLGLIYSANKIYPSVAAEELGVEAPFVTVMTTAMKNKGFITEEKDTTDNRKKYLVITKKGKEFVKTTEAEMRTQMRSIIAGVSPRAFADYLLVLEAIVRNTNDRNNSRTTP